MSGVAPRGVVPIEVAFDDHVAHGRSRGHGSLVGGTRVLRATESTLEIRQVIRLLDQRPVASDTTVEAEWRRGA